MESFGAKFGQLVRRYREAQGLSAAELALGAFGDEAKRSRISELENGKVKRPHAKTISALQVYLNIPQDELDECRKPIANDADTYLGQQSAEAKEAIQQSGLSDQQLLVLVQAFKDANEARERWFDLLLEKAALLQDLQARLAGISNDDPEVGKLRRQAEQAIEAADFAEAEALLEQAEAIDADACEKLRADMDEKQQTLNQRTESQARSAFARGELAEARLRYTEAYGHYRRAYELTPDSDERLVKAQNFAERAGDYDKAVDLGQTLLAKREQEFGPDDEATAFAANQLALAYEAQGKYAEAEPLYLRAIDIGEKTLGSDHPDLATGLNNLAVLYRAQGKYTEAEPLYLRDLAISEKTFGPDHPDVATTLNNLALLYEVQSKYEDAEPLYLRAIDIGEKTLGPDHPDIATTLNNLALLYEVQSKYEDAEPLYLRAIDIGEKTLGPDHPDLAATLNNLAALHKAQGKYAEAEPLYLRAIAIFERVFPDGHPSLDTVRANYADLKSKLG